MNRWLRWLIEMWKRGSWEDVAGGGRAPRHRYRGQAPVHKSRELAGCPHHHMRAVAEKRSLLPPFARVTHCFGIYSNACIALFNACRWRHLLALNTADRRLHYKFLFLVLQTMRQSIIFFYFSLRNQTSSRRLGDPVFFLIRRKKSLAQKSNDFFKKNLQI